MQEAEPDRFSEDGGQYRVVYDSYDVLVFVRYPKLKAAGPMLEHGVGLELSA